MTTPTNELTPIRDWVELAERGRTLAEFGYIDLTPDEARGLGPPDIVSGDGSSHVWFELDEDEER